MKCRRIRILANLFELVPHDLTSYPVQLGISISDIINDEMKKGKRKYDRSTAKITSFPIR